MAPVFHEAFKASNFKASDSVIYGKLAAERTIVTNPQPWPSASTGSLHRSLSFAAPTAQHAPKLYNDGQGSPVGLYFPKGDTGTHMVRRSLGHTQDGEGQALRLSQDPQSLRSRAYRAGPRVRRSHRPLSPSCLSLSLPPHASLSLAAALTRPVSPLSSWTASASSARSTSLRASNLGRPRTTR